MVFGMFMELWGCTISHLIRLSLSPPEPMEVPLLPQDSLGHLLRFLMQQPESSTAVNVASVFEYRQRYTRHGQK